MSTSPFKLSPLALAAFLMVNSVAHAQSISTATDTSATDPQPMSTVVITASADASAEGLSKAYAGGQVARGARMGILGNVDTMNSPFSSTAYTQQFIADQQARSIGDLLESDPSVRLSRGYGNFQEVYVIRGFALNSDDVGYNGLYGVLPRQYVSPELLERVEVFRGASSFLNGAAPGGSGVGGAINLVPKRAGNTPLTEVTLGVESGGHTYEAIDVGRRFGADQQYGVRINAAKRQGETAIENEKHDVGMLSVGLDYRSRDLRLSADLGYQNFNLTDPRPSVTTSGVTVLPSAPDADTNFGQPWSYSKENDIFGTVRGEYDLVKNVTAWAAFGERSTRESNSLSNPSLSDSNGDGVATLYRFDNRRKQTIRTGEVGLRAKLQTGPVDHTLVASWSGHWNDARNAYALGFGSAADSTTSIYNPVNLPLPTLGAPGGDMNEPKTTQKTISSSVAVADTMGFLDDTVLLTVGVRHQQINDTGYDYSTQASSSNYDKSANTPIAGIVYKVARNTSLFANYVEALVEGSVASGTDAAGNQVTNIGQIFAPYKSRQKEAGIKYDAGKLGMSASYFITGMPVMSVQGTLAGMYGQQRNQGVELSVFGMPANDVRLIGGLTLLNTEQRDTVNGATDGKDAIGVPDTQLNLSGEWDLPSVHGLTLTARTVYTSSQYADLANTKQLPSWTRLDLGARYLTTIADHAVTFRARIDNVTDRAYWASAGSSFNAGYLVLGAPRTFVLSGTVAF